MKKKRHYPGSRAGYSITDIAELMDCSISTARRWVAAREIEIGRKLNTPSDIAYLVWKITEYRRGKQLDKLLKDSYPYS
jgi:urease gamma subunit